MQYTVVIVYETENEEVAAGVESMVDNLISKITLVCPVSQATTTSDDGTFSLIGDPSPQPAPAYTPKPGGTEADPYDPNDDPYQSLPTGREF
jgi:hypothetical protein